ncbi:MAG: glucose-6-phosphate isomerase [Gammaproteobacteria bacterium]|nr:glucose-6-phosphate isomerase [Gammaproteobacteria bacterium]MBQ0839766.1 glucose-6-phosphate isomerase [Gammaproteobacteria bacterium]
MTDAALIDQSPAWQALLKHHQALSSTTLEKLFAQNPQRGRQFKASAAGLYFDYSKNLINDETLDLLNELANSAHLTGAIEELFSGADVNSTEQRPALHTALRNPVSGKGEIATALTQLRDAMNTFADRLRQGEERGASGKAFRNIINLGIGGSDLGPRMIVAAFPELQAEGLHSHFAANVDSDVLKGILRQCQPETTLFLISSKSFSTLETLSNAGLARQWLSDAGFDAAQIACHFAAMTSQIEKAEAWGIKSERIFPLDEGVGGRFSLWSSIGLPIAIALGSQAFQQLLDGASAMDEHFRHTPFRENLPALHGLLSIWSINFNNHHSRAVLPYIHRLGELPNYLQQLTMESLGKRVTKTGQPCTYATGPVIWGSEGTNGQHSCHQLLLQGIGAVPVDFIATRKAHCQPLQHQYLLANCFAQSRALMLGKSYEQALVETLATGLEQDAATQLAMHKAIPGNRVSNTLLLEDFSPRTLGALLAFYEHSVYVQSVIWQINAFDQWAVELGKTMSTAVFEALNQPTSAIELDSSSQALIDHIQTPATGSPQPKAKQ